MAAVPEWRKSSYSGGSGTGSCVEVAFGTEAVGVRDSKNADGPRLAFTPGRWREFACQTRSAAISR
ncbi:MAG TPA: DUF397 domain-containing protein [Pseudonocardiaceae bacterium]|jgi:hypothetical protein|nr:DUF397 domain-containing protein [Pseudonocardiaceae bacterium]